MYRMILADDEEIERKALKLLLQNSLPEIEVVADVGNGLALLEAAARFEPHILVVDINMPGVSGLEAIRQLRDRGCKAKIIVYTAYSYFEYARDALQYQVQDYLLKPAKRERFVETVRRSIASIEEDVSATEKSRELEELIRQISPTICSEFMMAVVLGDSDSKRLETYAKVIGLFGPGGYMMTFQLQTAQNALSDYDLLSNAIVQSDAAALIAGMLRELCGGIAGQLVNNQLACFVPADPALGEYRVKVLSTELAEVILCRVREEKGVAVTVGIGSAYGALKKLNLSYRESLNALHCQGVKTPIRHFGDLFERRAVANPFAKYQNELVAWMKQGDLESCRGRLEQVFQKHGGEVGFQELRDSALETVLEAVRSIEERLSVSGENRLSISTLFAHSAQNETPEQIFQWMLGVFEGLASRLHVQGSQKQSRTVAGAVAYIQDNLAQDISLEQTAETVGVSPYYLSRLFKDETGENFVGYLTRLKMERAKELLQKYGYSIKKVSDALGYSSPTYFCKVFKRYTGLTVGEYKKS